MIAQVEAIMREHGQDLTLIRGENEEETAVWAFLQPVRRKREELPVTVTPLGAVSDQRWLYIGPAAAELKPGDQIRSVDGRFAVQEAMTIRFRGDALYSRAVLRRRKERGQ